MAKKAPGKPAKASEEPPKRRPRVKGPPVVVGEKKRNLHAPIDWDTIEFEYVTGDDTVTHDYIRKRYGLTLRQVGHYASEHFWMVRRRAHRARVHREAREKILSDKAALLVETRMRGFQDRLEHLAQLEALRREATVVRLFKLKTEHYETETSEVSEYPTRVEEDIFEYAVPWSPKEHTYHRDAYDKAHAQLVEELGGKDAAPQKLSLYYFPGEHAGKLTPAELATMLANALGLSLDRVFDYFKIDPHAAKGEKD